MIYSKIAMPPRRLLYGATTAKSFPKSIFFHFAYSSRAMNNNYRVMFHLQNIKPLIGGYKVQSGNATLTILFYIFSMSLNENIA